MSRRTDGRPLPARPRVMLARTPGGRKQRGKTLIGQASRALYVAGMGLEAALMRDVLLAADPGEYRAILCAFVDFWPGLLVESFATGDPATHWATDHIPAEQRRKEAA
jgi:hypothetical protein